MPHQGPGGYSGMVPPQESVAVPTPATLALEMMTISWGLSALVYITTKSYVIRDLNCIHYNETLPVKIINKVAQQIHTFSAGKVRNITQFGIVPSNGDPSSTWINVNGRYKHVMKSSLKSVR